MEGGTCGPVDNSGIGPTFYFEFCLAMFMQSKFVNRKEIPKELFILKEDGTLPILTH